MDQPSYSNEPGLVGTFWFKWYHSTMLTLPLLNRRKRHLSDGDPDGCEFMPLSKRINNLHLNGSNLNAEATPAYTVSGKPQYLNLIQF